MRQVPWCIHLLWLRFRLVVVNSLCNDVVRVMRDLVDIDTDVVGKTNAVDKAR
jgi:hypothetical protein